MKLEPSEKKNYHAIKISSILLVSIAIALETWNLITRAEIAEHFTVIVTLERVMLISHFVEGIISAFYTENKLKYGIYVFFVGTVGLLELFPEKQLKE